MNIYDQDASKKLLYAVTNFKIPRPFHEVEIYYELVFVYHHISKHVGEIFASGVD